MLAILHLRRIFYIAPEMPERFEKRPGFHIYGLTNVLRTIHRSTGTFSGYVPLQSISSRERKPEVTSWRRASGREYSSERREPFRTVAPLCSKNDST